MSHRIVPTISLLALGLALGLASLLSASSAESATKPNVSRVSVAPSVLGPRTKGRITYDIAAASRVTVSLQKQRFGRFTSRTGCGAPSSRNRGGKPCSYFGAVVAKRTASARKGRNTMGLARRFAGRTLRSGLYRVTVKPRNGFFRQAAFKVRAG